jgi:excisionase family DNA binding protein
VELYLQEHPDVPREYPPAPEPPEPTDITLAFTANELRAIIHDEVTNALGVHKIAYTLKEAAIATGVSTTMIRAAVRRNDLTANYAGTKQIFTREDLKRWVKDLPEAPWRVTYR